MKTNVMLIIPEMCMGGAQRSLANLSHELARYANIFFVVFNNQEKSYYSTSGTMLSLEVYPGKGWLSKIKSLWSRVTKLKALKKKLAIDVSISFLEGADYVNVLSRGNEKVVLSIRGSKLHDEIMRGYHFWFRSKILIPSVYRKADLIVTVNEGIKNELVDHYGLSANKIHTINNFYDFSRINSFSKEPREGILNRLYEYPTIVTTGRLAPEKRLLFLIRVFIELKKVRPLVRLIIVGDGPEREKIIMLCKQASLQVSDDFLLAGEMPDILLTGNQKNVFQFLQGASIYVMNSSSEGFPNGLVEAMICGVPVISSDCPYGPREILAPEIDKRFEVSKPYISPQGVLMPLQNSNEWVSEWKRVIISILDSPETREEMSKNGKLRAHAFDKEVIVAKWSALIRGGLSDA